MCRPLGEDLGKIATSIDGLLRGADSPSGLDGELRGMVGRAYAHRFTIFGWGWCGCGALEKKKT